MTDSEYSHRSLAAKLGLKPGMKVAFINAPDDYKKRLGSIVDEVDILTHPANEMDFVQLFTDSFDHFTREFPSLSKKLKSNGMLWVSWPKGSSKVTTDLNENSLRDFGLSQGLVDVKVIAVDETWSGLKFIYRLKDR